MNCPVWIPSAAMKSSVLFLKRYGSRKATLARGAPRPGSWMISLRKRSENDSRTVSPLSGGNVGIFKGAFYFFFTFTIPLMYPWRSAKSILRSLAAPFLCLTWALNTDPAPFLCPLITRPMVSWNRAVYVSCRVDMWTHVLIPVRINYQIESCTFRFKRVKRYKPDSSTPICGIFN